MKKKIIGFYCIALLFLLQPFHVSAGPALETVQAQINKALDVLRDPSIAGESSEISKEEKILLIINGVFDYVELSKMALGRDWKKMGAAQCKEFTELFGELLRNVYMDRILAYTDEEIIFTKENELSEKKVEVQSEIVTKSKTIPVNYRLVHKNNEWKVYEVVIEGISLIRNYRSQFRDILRKKSPQELIEILRDKVEQA